MPFYSRVNDALGRANSAISQLYSYNHYAHPRSEPNAQIRNNARLTLDPATWELEQGVREGRYERVSASNARQALRAAELIRRATWDLSDQPDRGRPANVYQAQRNIREAVDLLYRARW
jgi:plasmid stabilization system protein ParE